MPKLDRPSLDFNRLQHVRLKRRLRKLRKFGRHPTFRVPAITLGILLILTVVTYVVALRTNHLPHYRDAKVVIIHHDNVEQIVPSKEDTVGQLIKELHIPINQGDVIEPDPATHIDQDQFRINIYRAVPVQIVDSTGQRTFAFSAAKTPRSIAQQTGAQLYPEDTVTTDPVQDFVRTGAVGAQVTIDRATPVNVDLYGTSVVLRTHAKTVAGLMKEKHIHLTKQDHLSVPASTPITPNESIGFIRTGSKVETTTETIPTPVQTIDDNSLAYGTSAVRQQGSPGQQVVTYSVQLVNNKETGRTLIQRVVSKAPVTQVVVVGTSLSGIKGDMALAGIAPGDYNYVDYIVSHESGWCPTKAQGEHYCPPQPDNAYTSGGYGLCQATPGYKMGSAGSDWATNPVTQLRWCSGYAQSRYGSWAAAYNHWLSYHNW